MSIVFERTYRARTLGHTFICDGGELGNLTLPVSFTDRCPAPESLRLSVEVLAELAGAMAAVKTGLDEVE